MTVLFPLVTVTGPILPIVANPRGVHSGRDISRGGLVGISIGTGLVVAGGGFARGFAGGFAGAFAGAFAGGFTGGGIRFAG